MIIKIYGVDMNFRPRYENNAPNQNTLCRYYETPPTKEEIKEDFGMVLDTELKKLHYFETYA